MIDFTSCGHVGVCGCGVWRTDIEEIQKQYAAANGTTSSASGRVDCGCKKAPKYGEDIYGSGSGHPTSATLGKASGCTGCGPDCDCEPCKEKHGHHHEGRVGQAPPSCPKPENYVSVFWIPFTIGATALGMYFGTQVLGVRR